MLSYLFAVLSAVVATISARPSTLFPLRHRQASTFPYAFPRSISPLIETEFGQVFDVKINIGGQYVLVLVDLGSSDCGLLKRVMNVSTTQTTLSYPRLTATMETTLIIHLQLSTKSPTKTLVFSTGLESRAALLDMRTLRLLESTCRSKKLELLKAPQMWGMVSTLGERETYDNTIFLYNRIPYTPLVWSMAELGLIKPYFSLAIKRRPLTEASGSGGFLAFGEVAPVSHSSNWASTPVVTLPQLPTNVTGNKTQLAYWTLEVKSVTYGPGSMEKATFGSSKTSIPISSCLTTSATSFNAILDNGNPLTFLPGHLAEFINTSFSPVASLPRGGEYLFFVDCNATAPTFGVEIGNQTFWHDPRDMIYYMGEVRCFSAIVRAEDVSLQGISSAFLGMQFFKNVLAIFDFGVDEMRFAARE